MFTHRELCISPEYDSFTHILQPAVHAHIHTSTRNILVLCVKDESD